MKLRPVVGGVAMVLALVVCLRLLGCGWVEIAAVLLGLVALPGLAHLGYRRLFDEREQGPSS